MSKRKASREVKRDSNEVVDDVVDVAIVGGGIAGAVAAIHLAKAGLRTVVFEKERAAHPKVCGEFMSREGAKLIEDCGVDLKGLGAVAIDRFRVHGPFQTLEGRLPEPALGLSRSLLDEQLLLAAERAGAEVRRGTLVLGVAKSESDESSEIVLATSHVGHGPDEAQVRARRLIVATGKFDLRSAQKRVGRDSGFVGFKQHLRLKPSLAKHFRGTCDLFVFKHGYGGLSPVEGGDFNFCFVFEKNALRKIGSDWNALSYHIAKQNWEASQFLDGAEPLFRAPVTVASIPYGFVRRERPEPGFYFVGDQMAVIPSLTGDGMSIAAMTGLEAARAIIDPTSKSRLSPARESAIAYQRAMRKRLKKQVEMGYRLHLIFKNPKLLDLATHAIRPFPSVLDYLVAKTRCTKPKLPLRAKAASLVRTLHVGRRRLTPI